MCVCVCVRVCVCVCVFNALSSHRVSDVNNPARDSLERSHKRFVLTGLYTRVCSGIRASKCAAALDQRDACSVGWVVEVAFVQCGDPRLGVGHATLNHHEGIATKCDGGRDRVCTGDDAQSDVM